MIQRRNFVRLIGGGIVAAAGAASLAACSLTDEMPATAIEIWNGPGDETDVRKRAIAFAVTAPNPHNRQPWLLDIRERDAITLYCDTDRLLPETDPFGRQILIGHGAFLELLAMALAQQGVRCDVQLWPEGELPHELKEWQRQPVARVRLSAGGTPDPLFARVLQRHTPKIRFDTARPVSGDTLQSLIAVAPTDGPVRAGGTVDIARVLPLRALCMAAARVELITPRTAMESVRLTRVGPDEILAHRDGIAINSPMVRIVTGLGQFDRSAPPVDRSLAFKQTMQVFEDFSSTAMGFVWLSTARNSRTDQIAAGRAYVRQQLRATELGVGIHPMSQALQEFPEMAQHFATVHRLLLNTDAPHDTGEPTVQMMCRVGYPTVPMPAAPRRPLADFITA